MSGDQNTIKNGGPAFPCDDLVDQSGNVHRTAGMTLRDYFAAKAMASLILVYQDPPETGTLPVICSSAYQYADAMLRAREVQP